jgi:hypothetical protein
MRSCCIVSRCAGVVGALGGREQVENTPDGVPEAADGSLGGLSQQRLELGEGILDGVEVWAVGREIAQLGTRSLDHLAHAWAFVAGQVVHDDDVATPQFRDQHLGHLGLEGVAVDRPIEHPGGDEAAHGQSADEGRGLPVAVGDADPQPCPTQATPMATRHVGRSPYLVDEDQPVGIEIELILEPPFAPDQHVGAVLIGGVRGLFLRVMAWRAKKLWIVPKPNMRPCSARLARTSSIVASLPGPSAAITTSWCASIRSERRSPPSRPGRGAPCSRSRLR